MGILPSSVRGRFLIRRSLSRWILQPRTAIGMVLLSGPCQTFVQYPATRQLRRVLRSCAPEATAPALAK